MEDSDFWVSCLLQLRLGSSGSSMDPTDLNDPRECDGKGSETHVPVSFQVFFI